VEFIKDQSYISELQISTTISEIFATLISTCKAH